MNDLSGTDRSQVAVALIGEHHGVVTNGTLDAGSNSGCTTVSGLVHIAVKIIVGKHGAANGGNTDNLALQVHLVQDLGHQTVDDTMMTTGAVMELLVGQKLSLFEQNCHLTYPPSC